MSPGQPRPERDDGQHLRWSEPMWSPPPESNRRPHPYHGTTGEPLCGSSFSQVAPDRRGQSYRFSFGEVMRSLQAMHWSSRRSHKSRQRPRAQHLFPLNLGIYPAVPPWGAPDLVPSATSSNAPSIAPGPDRPDHPARRSASCHHAYLAQAAEAPNSDSRIATACSGSRAGEASIPLLPSQWAAAAVRG
jgi:hypothetical protein